MAKKYGDTYKREQLEGKKVKLELIIGKKIELLAATVRNSQHHAGKCTTLQFKILRGKGQVSICHCGSQVIAEQTQEIINDENFPLELTITKGQSKTGNTYYTFA